LLKGGTSQLVSEHYGCNTSCMIIFLKTNSEDILRCPYKDYSSLNMWQANLNLLSIVYYSVMTHLRQGKKVSLLPSGDVSPGPIPSRQDLLEDSPYHAVGTTCLLCDCPRPCTYGMGT
jgi:hypothetical protein